MLTLVSGLTAILITATVSFMLGFHTAAWLIGNVGTLVWMWFMAILVAIRDPLKKWPNVNAFQRLINILTFRTHDGKW